MTEAGHEFLMHHSSRLQYGSTLSEPARLRRRNATLRLYPDTDRKQKDRYL